MSLHAHTNGRTVERTHEKVLEGVIGLGGNSVLGVSSSDAGDQDDARDTDDARVLNHVHVSLVVHSLALLVSAQSADRSVASCIGSIFSHKLNLREHKIFMYVYTAHSIHEVLCRL
jgi:hypothetical protein